MALRVIGESSFYRKLHGEISRQGAWLVVWQFFQIQLIFAVWLNCILVWWLNLIHYQYLWEFRCLFNLMTIFCLRTNLWGSGPDWFRLLQSWTGGLWFVLNGIATVIRCIIFFYHFLHNVLMNFWIGLFHLQHIGI